MPELPEVETIRQNLRRGGSNLPGILGWTIESAQVLWGRTLATPGVDEFRWRLPGQQVIEIDRRGKFLIIELSRDALLVHLRMSGDLAVEEIREPLSSHCRVAIEFKNGQRLAFLDARKFGRIWLTAEREAILSDLGPEPLDEAFQARDLYRRLHVHRRRLKPLLLDQTFLAGLGNIYADEALNLARLHPLTLSNQVSEAQAEQLWRAIRAVIEEGIQRNGASIDWVYRGGDFQNYFRVYQRTGQPCRECGEAIQRIVIGQRSAHFCPNCQQL